MLFAASGCSAARRSAPSTARVPSAAPASPKRQLWLTPEVLHSAAVVPPGSAVARRSAEVLDELLAKGEAAPLRLGQLPVRFETGGGAKGKARREVPVSVRC